MADKKDISLYESVVKYDPNVKVAKSAAWISAKLPELVNGKNTKALIVGKMYAFAYNPIGKQHLPYWDMFPLIILLKNDGRTITGLNVHYMPPARRLMLFRKLLNSMTTSKLTKTTRINSPLNIIKAIPNHQYMIKQYSSEGIVSNIIEIPGDEWGHAITLPLAEFKTGNKDSNKMEGVLKSTFSHTLTAAREMSRFAKREL